VTPAAAEARRAVQTRNATEEAILDAARGALAEKGFDALTMDAIARKAFVSRTAVYFYFPNKRAVVDRLIQTAFSEMYLAASPYLDGDGDPRRELRAGLSRVVAVVNRHARVLLLAAQLSGARGEHLPDEWAPFITRFAERAEARISRDQQRGIAPDDISAKLCAQSLLAMVENHIVRELVLGHGDATESIRALAELWWRAAYSRPDDVAAAVASASDAAASLAAAGGPARLAPASEPAPAAPPA
jgi:AcrR family transcriptional regulator